MVKVMKLPTPHKCMSRTKSGQCIEVCTDPTQLTHPETGKCMSPTSEEYVRLLQIEHDAYVKAHDRRQGQTTLEQQQTRNSETDPNAIFAKIIEDQDSISNQVRAIFNKTVSTVSASDILAGILLKLPMNMRRAIIDNQDIETALTETITQAIAEYTASTNPAPKKRRVKILDAVPTSKSTSRKSAKKSSVRVTDPASGDAESSSSSDEDDEDNESPVPIAHVSVDGVLVRMWDGFKGMVKSMFRLS